MSDPQIIYLVDDDDDDRFFIREAVESVIEKVKVLEFTSGVEFLKTITQPGLNLNFGLVLMDINMPQMSGLEVIAELKSLPHSKELPVLAISTAAHPQVIRDAIATGASGYFIKPSSPSGLLQLASDIKDYMASH